MVESGFVGQETSPNNTFSASVRRKKNSGVRATHQTFKPKCKHPQEKNNPHNMPHIHAIFSGNKISMAFNGEVLSGSLPRKQMKLLDARVALHEDELNAAWIALNGDGEVIKIKGLE